MSLSDSYCKIRIRIQNEVEGSSGMKIGVLDSNTTINSEAFVISGHCSNYMIDTGYKGSFNELIALNQKVIGANPDYLIISHGDSDHRGALDKVLAVHNPKGIIFSPLHVYKHSLLSVMTNSFTWASALLPGNRSPLARYFSSDDFKFHRFRSTVLQQQGRNNDRILPNTAGIITDRYNLHCSTLYI